MKYTCIKQGDERRKEEKRERERERVYEMLAMCWSRRSKYINEKHHVYINLLFICTVIYTILDCAQDFERVTVTNLQPATQETLWNA